MGAELVEATGKTRAVEQLLACHVFVIVSLVAWFAQFIRLAAHSLMSYLLRKGFMDLSIFNCHFTALAARPKAFKIGCLLLLQFVDSNLVNQDGVLADSWVEGTLVFFF